MPVFDTWSLDEGEENVSPGKKVHFAGDGKENQQAGCPQTLKTQELLLHKRLQTANLRAQALGEVERNYHRKSRQILGIR